MNENEKQTNFLMINYENVCSKFYTIASSHLATFNALVGRKFLN